MAAIFSTIWDSVYQAICWVVNYGVVKRDLDSITSIGIDEIQYRRGHKYLTLVFQLDDEAKRLLYVAKDRTEESFLLSEETRHGIQYACTDMWPASFNPYRTTEKRSWHGVRSASLLPTNMYK